MEGKAAKRVDGALGDLVELFAKALLSGIGVAVALSLAILALSATAQTAALDEPNSDLGARAPASPLFPNPGARYLEGAFVFPLSAKPAAGSLPMMSVPRGNPPWSVAPTPPHDADAAGVGALWAKARIESRTAERFD